MKTIIYLTIFSLIVIITACATPQPSQQQIMNADYGDYPENYQEIIKNFMEQRMFDPYSAVYTNWTTPTKAWYGGKWYSGKQIKYGYKVCVDINGKNKLGGYVGYQLFYFLIKDGYVIAVQGGGKRHSMDEEIAVELCNL